MEESLSLDCFGKKYRYFLIIWWKLWNYIIIQTCFLTFYSWIWYVDEMIYLWCNCIGSIIRWKTWSIVHQTFSIIWYIKCKWCFLFDKIPAMPCQNLVPIYGNVLVPITSGVLMVKPKGMDKFMGDGLFWITIISTSERRHTKNWMINQDQDQNLKWLIWSWPA